MIRAAVAVMLLAGFTVTADVQAIRLEPAAARSRSSSTTTTARNSSTSIPPECRPVVMVYNSGRGPTVRSLWCGTGAAGEPPVQEGTGALHVIVDGGPFGNGAVVLWPASPPS